MAAVGFVTASSLALLPGAMLYTWVAGWRAPTNHQDCRLRATATRRAFSESDLTAEQRATFDHYVKTQVVEDAAVRQENPFPLSQEDLIWRAKLYLALNHGEVKVPELLADDFEFAGPIIGPLGKDKFMEQLKGFNFLGAFPDANNQWHDFRVDPFETDRVWFACRGYGTNLGAAPPLVPEPTGKRFENPPQTCSLRFNEAGEVKEYTIGYVMDRRQGNTGGVGGLLGILYAIGKPFPYPESKPYEKSWQRRLFEGVVEFLVSLQPKPEK